MARLVNLNDLKEFITLCLERISNVNSCSLVDGN